jgi:putative transposase
MKLNLYGEIAKEKWVELYKLFKNVLLDEFVVMPNHVRGIIMHVNEYKYFQKKIT